MYLTLSVFCLKWQFAQSREFFKCCFNADMNRVFIVLTYVAKCMQQGTLEILLILDHLTMYLHL